MLQHWASEQATRRPSAVAVSSGHETLTYAELDALSTQLARVLRKGGCQRGDRVALLMPKGCLALVGLLGIYKADAVYVPLDPASPAKRLSAILDLCETTWLLAGNVAGPALEALGDRERDSRDVRIVWLDGDPAPASLRAHARLSDVLSMSGEPLRYRNTADDIAHILFTSGSTGTPKGVMITHANVVSFIEWATTYLGLDERDRLSGHAPLPFDLSFLDIFGTFASGASLHLVPPALNVLPNRLAAFIRDHELTQWFSVPSVLAYLAQFDVIRPGDFPALRRVLWCGDVLATPVLRYWMERLPHATFDNLYGPTETTVASSFYRVPECPDDAAAIPIGTACDGEQLLVLDDDMNVVPPETVGHLYIAGSGLARGYWQDPVQTSAAFVPHPTDPSARIYRTGDLAHVGRDGLCYFHGRNDSQIKRRGYRIELGEIESALNGVAGVHESAVVAIKTDRFDGAAICGVCVAKPGSDLTLTSLNRQLQELIPTYMLPSRWLLLDELPRTMNGKTDR
ncbi:MAG TPA: amino acid adenylation domain-containing protein, partial [Vicinamibacterales bacterium]|nr:amino acid adenylation domain-containing protein [Vicinamibacterales bacterium]